MGARRHRHATAPAAVLGVLLVGAPACSSDPEGGQARDSPVTAATSGRAPTTDASSTTPTTATATTDPACAAVEEARAGVDAAVVEALDRLGVGRNAPETFTVSVVVTAQESPDYWRQVLADVPTELAGPADRVLTHWTRLEDALRLIPLDDARPETLTQAAEDVTRLTASGQGVAEDERTLEAWLERRCPPGA